MKLYKFNAEDLEDAKSHADYKMFIAGDTVEYKETYRFACIKHKLLNETRSKKTAYRNLHRHWEYENIVKNVVEPKIDLDIINLLTKQQKKVMLKFLELGCLVKTAEELNLDYNTTKAHYRHAIMFFRNILKKEGSWKLLR